MTFLLGYLTITVAVAAVFDLRRALRSPQEREQAFQQRERIGGDHGV